MSYGEEISDDGAYLAEQDYYAEQCEINDGDCKVCPHKYECQSSDYKREQTVDIFRNFTKYR